MRTAIRGNHAGDHWRCRNLRWPGDAVQVRALPRSTRTRRHHHVHLSGSSPRARTAFSSPTPQTGTTLAVGSVLAGLGSVGYIAMNFHSGTPREVYALPLSAATSAIATLGLVILAIGVTRWRVALPAWARTVTAAGLIMTAATSWFFATGIVAFAEETDDKTFDEVGASTWIMVMALPKMLLCLVGFATLAVSGWRSRYASATCLRRTRGCRPALPDPAVPAGHRVRRRWPVPRISGGRDSGWWSRMTQIRQFYGANGAPFAVPGRLDEIAAAWTSHRQRLRGWFTALTEDGWSGATRCTDWGVLDLAQHLISGSQFLGYTLHQSRKGEATRLLEGFDPQTTPALSAAQFAGLSPRDLLERMTDMDARVEHELGSLAVDGGAAPAEAPPGQVPAHVAVNHFLFDSWVHERDLMLPANELPVTEPNEAAMVASYVVGLTGLAQCRRR